MLLFDPSLFQRLLVPLQLLLPRERLLFSFALLKLVLLGLATRSSPQPKTAAVPKAMNLEYLSLSKYSGQKSLYVHTSPVLRMNN